MVNKPLSASLIFGPLAVGATMLTLLLALLPFRLMTFLALGSAFMALGAAALYTILALICFSQASARLGLLFTPNTIVHPCARPPVAR